MQRIAYLLSFLFFITAAPFASKAQEGGWPSPEVEQMYKQARDYLSAGNLQQAIVTYEQAIRLAPNKMVLYRDLGKAYFLTKRYSDAERTLTPLVNSTEADAQSYQQLAACYLAEGEKKKGKAMLQKGIEKFPNSGLLYHDMGKLYEEDNEDVYALEFWLDGIKVDPRYHVNYYEAARMYMNTKKVVWAIIYGEMFVNIEHETPRAMETRKMLLDGYRALYTNMKPGEVPEFGKARKEDAVGTFDEAVYISYLNLSPVIADGVNTETLTMLRTRFLMSWLADYGSKYPFSLYTYQDDMLRNGLFDVYNEWLFGKIDNSQEFQAWNKFHEGAMAQFESWQALHPMPVVTTDFYNDKNVDEIFTKKKKK